MDIYERISTKNIVFKNRVIMSPMATASADDDGHVFKKILDYYDEKTKDGVFSAVIVEHSYVDKTVMAQKNQMSISKDSDMEGMKKLADVIKKNGSLAILQISHSGSLGKKEVICETPVAPSPIANPARETGEIPRELSIYEIHNIMDKFISAAIRDEKAGFDGVETHSVHAYLLDEFLSPLTNKREDDYGKDIYGRIKLHLEIIKGTRENLGDEYPILLRMGAGDFKEGGLSKEDSLIAAKAFEDAGVDV